MRTNGQVSAPEGTGDWRWRLVLGDYPNSIEPGNAHREKGGDMAELQEVLHGSRPTTNGH